ncbi:putative lipoprotein [Laribacter hongkongensis HLHK9]|uniref:Putative lipoprotein n=1 Tax=Laribacter hongkongensis (strain HLHK9) TaxID=557598 RepID=C1DBV3_LARHH|nr:spore coat U domain-containing protein [Laribacter hongkongensis]ACO75506.1 putative lipoprotein [Laribacter hongkongensis HLHK9]
MPKNIKPVNFLPAILLAICAFHVQQAHALCTLACSCSVSVTSVAFGTYNVFSPTPLTGTGSVDVSCGGVAGLLVPYDIAISAGAYPQTGVSTRRMANGSNMMAYSLYTNATRSIIWGDGTEGSQKISDSLTLVLLGNVSRSYPVYGSIPAGQMLTPGSYSDTPTVTLTYY